MQKCSIVVDLGFGDSGKGLTTDFLAGQNPDQNLVVRFSGGHQVGHTVVTDEYRHTFSNFGSGTLRGVPSYYSEYTTIFPPGIAYEGSFLEKYHPQIFIHPLAMVTTPYDVAFNRAIEKEQQHGSCGLGFGSTIERNKEEVHCFALDLQNSWVLEQRLASISKYYNKRIQRLKNDALTTRYKHELTQFSDSDFIASCKSIKNYYSIKTLNELKPAYQHFIFEGSQGIMLDTKHGIYPHTTWSNTTSQNAWHIISSTWPKHPEIDIYYVTRCYQTRHGNGPMSTSKAVFLKNNSGEANVENAFQGKFRTSVLDANLIAYAISCDQVYHQSSATKHLMITCLDQIPDFSTDAFLKQLSYTFKAIFGSYGPKASDIRKLQPPKI